MIILNNELVNVTKFSDGTSQLWKLTDAQFGYCEKKARSSKSTEVFWKFEHESEIIHLCQLSDLVKTIYNNNGRYLEIVLNAPFLPYGRQDKLISNKSTFALSTFLNVIGEYYNRIITLDMHNERCMANAYGFVKSVFPEKEIEFAIDNSEANVVCYPDEGAFNRYHEKCEILTGVPYVVLDKVRDPLTGDIIGLKILENTAVLSNKTSRILAIDDICDGGKTFIEASKLLRNNCQSFDLYTTHGIYSKGKEVIYNSGIRKIYNRRGLV